MRVPQITLVVDGTELTGPQAALALAWVDIAMGAAHDRARLVMSWQSPVADLVPGTQIELSVGYDEPQLVLTGLVDMVARRPWGVVTDVLAGPSKLSTTRVGRSYINLSAGDIVRDLLSEAAVGEGDVGDGPTLAAVHVDERRSAWQHLQGLAVVSGSEVSTSADGALNFTPAPGAGPGGLAGTAASAVVALTGPGGGTRYGAELHDFSFGPAAELGSRPTVAAHGAGSELGAQKWHILLGEPDGGAPSGITLLPTVLRDREGADLLRGAIDAAADRATTRGWFDVTGNAALRPRDTIEVTGLPYCDDTSVRVRQVRHCYSSDSGFVTRIGIEGAAA